MDIQPINQTETGRPAGRYNGLFPSMTDLEWEILKLSHKIRSVESNIAHFSSVNDPSDQMYPYGDYSEAIKKFEAQLANLRARMNALMIRNDAAKNRSKNA